MLMNTQLSRGTAAAYLWQPDIPASSAVHLSMQQWKIVKILKSVHNNKVADVSLPICREWNRHMCMTKKPCWRRRRSHRKTRCRWIDMRPRRTSECADTDGTATYKPDRQWRSSSFQESAKVRVSRDLWPWPWPWAHLGCMLTWSPSCESLVAIRPFVCEKKRFAQKFTDGRTDGRTDDGRRAIALAYSWNELTSRVINCISSWRL